MRQRVLWINLVLVAALAGVGIIAYFMVRTSSPAAAATQTATVSTGDITSTISASGNAASATNYGISFASDCSGNLTSVAVKAGDVIKVGQVLATVDPATANAAVTTAQTALTAAQTSLNNSITSAKTSLSNTQATTNLDISQSQAAVNTAQANYDAAPTAQNQSSLTQAQNSLASTKLKDGQQVAAAQTALTQAEASTTPGRDRGRHGAGQPDRGAGGDQRLHADLAGGRDRRHRQRHGRDGAGVGLGGLEFVQLVHIARARPREYREHDEHQQRDGRQALDQQRLHHGRRHDQDRGPGHRDRIRHRLGQGRRRGLDHLRRADLGHRAPAAPPSPAP